MGASLLALAKSICYKVRRLLQSATVQGTAADLGRRFVGLPLRGSWGLVALFADITLGDLGYCRGEHKRTYDTSLA